MAQLVPYASDPAGGWRAVDGDTIVRGDRVVRLQNVFAAEKDEPGGLDAKARLQRELDRGLVRVAPAGRDIYNRELADVYIGDRKVIQTDIGPRAGRGADYVEDPRAITTNRERLQLPPDAREPIVIPEWRDVLHVQPNPTVEKKQYFATRLILERAAAWNGTRAQMEAAIEQLARRGELPAGVTVDQAREVARRRDMQLRISETAVPEWRQTMVKVLTAADNVEDLVSTVEWLSRPLQGLHPALRVIGGALRATSSALDRIQRVLAQPSIIGRRQKHLTEKQRRANARTRQTKVSGPQRAVNWIKDNFGHLLEAGQAADTVAGVGIQLGGIMGAITETQDRLVLSAWHGAIWNTANLMSKVPGLPDSVRYTFNRTADEAVEEIRKSGAPLIAQVKAAAPAIAVKLSPVGTFEGLENIARDALRIQSRGPFGWLADKMRSAATIGQHNPLWTPGDHALALWTASNAGAPLAYALQLVADELEPERIAELPMPRLRVTDEVTRLMLEEMGARFNSRGEAMGEWADVEISALEQFNQGVELETDARRTWLPMDFKQDEDQLLHALVEGNLPTTALTITGSIDGISSRFEPAVRAEMLLYETGNLPPIGFPDHQVRAWLDEQSAAAAANPDDYDTRTWNNITDKYW